MKNERLKSNIMLLLAAIIWGFAFVAQRVGSKYIGSFMFNGVRFALGSISLLPLIIYTNKKNKKSSTIKSALPAGIIAGSILFFGASLQQIGLVNTSAGKAAFITGLYIVLVPIFGMFLKHKTGMNSWVGAFAAVIGLYLLSVNESFIVEKYDIYEIIGAFFWTAHILVIDNFTKKVDALKLSFVQFLTCSVLSLIIGFAFESNSIQGLYQASIPILYGGICSVGIAYTLQVFGQKFAKPSHAAIILSMESVFASLGGFIFLNENLGVRGYIGCIFMLTGMLISQIKKN